MPASRSEFVRVRGLRYHLRRWGDRGKPLLVLGHGFMDASASFDALVQQLLEVCQVLAPDWRGFGHSAWPEDGYWFPDYVADLDLLLAHCADAEAPLWMAGHSMGAQIFSLYAGLRPARVAKLIILDGLFIPDMPADHAAERYRAWLAQLRRPLRAKTYASFESLAERICAQHPRLNPRRALQIAHSWGADDGHSRVRLLADPRHRLNMPGLYREDESMAIWREVLAETLFIDGGRSIARTMISAGQHRARRACFRRHHQLQIADAGHMLHFDAPVETAQAMLDFLGP